MATIQLLSIQVSLPRTVAADEAPDPGGKSWRTGFFKQPVAGPVQLGSTNLAGDGQGDQKNHGGVDKAVLLYAAQHYPAWRVELAKPDLPYGAFGENLTLDGIDEHSACIGDVYAIGEARLEVTQPRQPCWKIAARWQIPDLTARVDRSGRTGWYCRVLQQGLLEAGAAVSLAERPYPEWTIERAAAVMHNRADRIEAAQLAALPPLAAVWRKALQARADLAPV